jgi:AraC-like DNA-binding protein
MIEEEFEIDAIKKQFILIYVLIVLVFESISMIASWQTLGRELRIVSVIGLFFQLCAIVASYKFSYTTLKPFIAIYIVFGTLFIIIRLIYMWQNNINAVYLWLIVAPFSMYVLFSNKAIVYWTIYIFSLGLVSFFVGDIFSFYGIEIKDESPINNNRIAVWRILNFIGVFMYLSFCLYYIDKIQKKKIQLLESKVDQYKKNEQKLNGDEKYNRLYKVILKYFENKKPYINPDFEISQLAIALNTNIAYISKAIKINQDTNFNTFVNTYRIEKIKEMIQEEYGKYTLEYIYASSGFKNQSTFNKVFKSVEGITPSEYYKKIQASIDCK